MKRPGPRPTPPADSTEPFKLEWIRYGLNQLDEYLARQAAFDAWLAAHPKEGDA